MEKLENALSKPTNYLLALHLDPKINKDLSDFLGLNLPENKKDRLRLYVPLLSLTCDAEHRTDLIKAAEKAAKNSLPIKYWLKECLVVKDMNDDSKRSILYRMLSDIGLYQNAKIYDLIDEIYCNTDFEILNSQSIFKDSPDFIGISGLDRKTALLFKLKSIYHKIDGKAKRFLSGEDYPLRSAFRLAIFENVTYPSGDYEQKLLGEFDVPRRRWIGPHMSEQESQWELSRFALGFYKN